MSDPMPVRTIKAARITRAAEVVETVEITEYASAPPAARQELEAPPGARRYDPEQDSPLAGTGMHLDAAADGPRAALPPGPPAPARPWWLRRWFR